MRRLLFVLLLSSAPAHAADWGERDTAMLGGALGLMAVDWAQTRDLARQTQWNKPECADAGFRSAPAAVNAQCATVPVYREINPLLPSHPTTSQVDRYFALAMIGTAGLSYALPNGYRSYFLGTVIVLESLVVLHNHSIGLRVSF
jgi:hypothetical protein